MDLKQIMPLVLQVALVLMIGSVGLRAKWKDVINALVNVHGLLRAIVAVNVVVPLTAVLVCMVLPIPPAIKFGIVIMAVSPLAPVLPGKLLKAGMDASRVAGLYALLIGLAVVIVPVTITLLNRLFAQEVATPVNSIAALVLISVMAPLAAGMILSSVAPTLAERLAGPANLFGTLLLASVGLTIIATQAADIEKLIGNGAVLAMAVTAAAGIVAGHLLGGPDSLGRKSLALAAATRHPGIAAIIIKANFDDKRTLLSIILFLLISVIVSHAYQLWLMGRDRRAARETRAA